MKLKSFSSVLICYLFFTFFFNGCMTNSFLSNGYIDGQIMVVGNDPFTKLSVFDSSNNCYILECSEKLKNELWKKQGSFIRVFFDSYKQDLVGIKLIVNHVEFIKQLPR
jgi:hypothetical protein